MKISYKSIAAIGLILSLSGCALFDSDDAQVVSQAQNTPISRGAQPQYATGGQPVCLSSIGQVIDCNLVQAADDNYADIQSAPISNTHPLVSSNNTVLIGEYIEQMATHMLESLTVPAASALVGVTSFVEFTDDLASVNQLGNMLAESFIYELQQNGIPVVDYKVASGVRVQRDGDFVFSRNPANLNLNDSMQYVLTGTIMYNKRGLVINARMVNFMNKRVVASSKKVIPYFVLDSIIPTSEKHAVIGS